MWLSCGAAGGTCPAPGSRQKDPVRLYQENHYACTHGIQLTAHQGRVFISLKEQLLQVSRNWALITGKALLKSPPWVEDLALNTQSRLIRNTEIA